jgi:hypothetical protein
MTIKYMYPIASKIPNGLKKYQMASKIPYGLKNTIWPQKYHMASKIPYGLKNTKWPQTISNVHNIGTYVDRAV